MTASETEGICMALIPARGGSKRIPRKNIKEFCGKPMIAYPIETAKKSGLFHRIIVSTEDEEIAEIARTFGAEIPFARPRHLADDTASTLSVIQHAVKWAHRNGQPVHQLCCIYPATPLLQASHLINGLALLNREKAAFSYPVAAFPSSIFRAMKQTPENRLEMFWPEHIDTRTQDLPEAFHDAGQFYWGRASAFLNNTTIVREKSCPLIIPRHLALDIDTLEDWHLAELMFRALYPQQGPQAGAQG